MLDKKERETVLLKPQYWYWEYIWPLDVTADRNTKKKRRSIREKNVYNEHEGGSERQEEMRERKSKEKTTKTTELQYLVSYCCQMRGTWAKRNGGLCLSECALNGFLSVHCLLRDFWSHVSVKYHNGTVCASNCRSEQNIVSCLLYIPKRNYAAF